eukprot:scaffold88051_cov15-Prasinocladus_malaysianus.AAC.1
MQKTKYVHSKSHVTTRCSLSKPDITGPGGVFYLKGSRHSEDNGDNSQHNCRSQPADNEPKLVGLKDIDLQEREAGSWLQAAKIHIHAQNGGDLIERSTSLSEIDNQRKKPHRHEL